MSAWSDQDYRDDRLEAYGQSVGDNVYGDWSLDTLIDEITEATQDFELLLDELRLVAGLPVDDPGTSGDEQGDDRPLTGKAA